MLAAETAVLVELQTIRIVLLVFKGVVVPLFALGAGQSDLYAHVFLPPVSRNGGHALAQTATIKIKPLVGGTCTNLSYTAGSVNDFFPKIRGFFGPLQPRTTARQAVVVPDTFYINICLLCTPFFDAFPGKSRCFYKNLPRSGCGAGQFLEVHFLFYRTGFASL